MVCDWGFWPPNVKKFVNGLTQEIRQITKNEFVGLYVHGSLAMGGFNPDKSDVDSLVATKQGMTIDTKKTLARLFLNRSDSPFPVEISFLTEGQLRNWQHPCPFDFHFSEFWRERYQCDLDGCTYHFLNDRVGTDADLAAHITIINSKGICVEGKQIKEVFPVVTEADYKASIMNDFQECLQRIEEEPIYCILNLIRVYGYLKEGIISSKLDAGTWGQEILLADLSKTAKHATDLYMSHTKTYHFDADDLTCFKSYMEKMCVS